MALVAWILAIAGAGLALVMGMSKPMSHRRNLELGTVLAAQEGTPVRELVFPGGPVVIAAGTLLGIVRAYLGQEKRRL